MQALGAALGTPLPGEGWSRVLQVSVRKHHTGFQAAPGRAPAASFHSHWEAKCLQIFLTSQLHKGLECPPGFLPSQGSPSVPQLAAVLPSPAVGHLHRCWARSAVAVRAEHTHRVGTPRSRLQETESWDVTGTSPDPQACLSARAGQTGPARWARAGAAIWAAGRRATAEVQWNSAKDGGPGSHSLTHPPTAGSSSCLAHLGSRCSLLLVLAHMPPMASPACPTAVPGCAMAHWVWSLPVLCPEAAPLPHTLCVYRCVPHTPCVCWCWWGPEFGSQGRAGWQRVTQAEQKSLFPAASDGTASPGFPLRTQTPGAGKDRNGN